jgi:hypothetical protein
LQNSHVSPKVVGPLPHASVLQRQLHLDGNDENTDTGNENASPRAGKSPQQSKAQTKTGPCKRAGEYTTSQAHFFLQASWP